MIKPLAIVTFLALAPAVSGTVYRPAVPSNDILISNFCQKLLTDPTVAVSAQSLSQDIGLIRPSLLPLLTIAWQHPPLEKSVLDCVKTLLLRDTRTPSGYVSVKRAHEAALAECQQEFKLYCQTEAENEAVATSLKSLGLFYNPAGFAASLDNQEENDEKSTPTHKNILIAAALGVVGIAAAVVLTR